MSMYFSHSSTMSSPSRNLENPGPCAWTRGFPLYCSTVGVPPKIIARSQEAKTAAPASGPPGYRANTSAGIPASMNADVIR